ncbi:LPXTG cell wall anchor domain-containing protein [Candidatus Bathyarchaeota archaeon]|nr:LPXTG cell wall anchor domain-containing protein [Candidatus Bathyarchaeota archaeon]
MAVTLNVVKQVANPMLLYVIVGLAAAGIVIVTALIIIRKRRKNLEKSVLGKHK